MLTVLSMKFIFITSRPNVAAYNELSGSTLLALFSLNFQYDIKGQNFYLKLHGLSMLPDKAKFVECSIISRALSFCMKHLFIGQLQKPAKFSAFHWSLS